MTKMSVTIELDDYQAKAVAIDKAQNLFGDLSDEDYLAVRLMEYVTAKTEQHIQQPQIAVVVEDLKRDPDTLKAEAKKRGLDIDAAVADVESSAETPKK